MLNATRTQSTESEYYHRAINLSIKAHKEAVAEGVNVQKITVLVNKDGKSTEALHILATAKWARAKWIKVVNPRTWRKYRCSVRFYAETLLRTRDISEKAFLEIESIMSGNSKLNNRKSQNTSAKKKKHFNDGDLELIINTLSESKAQSAKVLRNWLYINILVGLRPIEWKTVRFKSIDRAPHLIVLNAKRTNNRSHGEFRQISLSNLTEHQLKLTKGLVGYFNKVNELEKFEHTYEDCRKLLQRVCKKIWPSRSKQISLYTTRHQFSADLKKNGKSLVDIAYLMGHISTDTATAHYGKKRYGKNKLTPDVDPSLVKGIKNKFDTFTFKQKRFDA